MDFFTENPTFSSSFYKSHFWFQPWVRKNGLYKRHKHKHVVLLHLPAQFGSEAILRHIFDQSGQRWKIHVGHKKFQEYLCTDDLGGCTSSGKGTIKF